MKIKIFLTFVFFFFSFSSYSTNIRVLNFQQIIDANNTLKLLYDEIENDQKKFKKEFITEELNLESELERIEKLNLILETSEIEKEIELYNNKLKNFNEKIEKFNLHYESQTNELKNILINYTLELLKKYSVDNEIDLILDSNNYILSNNSINITNIIAEQLNKKKIETNFEKYK